jgi:Tfp pilus assembly protein PilW
MRARDQGSGIGDQRSGIGEQGFTLVELLIAMGITLAISGAIAALAPTARTAFERVPADLEIQQRGRAALDILTQAVRAAGKDVAAANLLGSMADLFPAITLSDPDESGTAYEELTAIVPVPDPAQGVLESDQASGSAPITLATAACPNVKDVCGFTAGVAAVVVDAAGHFDVFIVASTSAGARRLTPDRALSRPYSAGSVVVEIEQTTFRLDQQADESFSLMRVTAAGAVQPVVDYLSALSFALEGQQLAVGLTVQPQGIVEDAHASRHFRTSIRLRNAR